jgi:IMP dehydrogenase
MRIKKSYSYDDLLLVPKKSEIQHRADVSTKVDLGKGIVLDIPIISANMKFVTGPKLAQAMSQVGGMALLHRFNDNRDQDYLAAINWLSASLKYYHYVNYIGVSVGTTEQEKQYFVEKYLPLKELGLLKIICIDVAHGHHKNTSDMIQFVRGHMPDVLIVAGNVATGEGALFLAGSGADVIKSGVGAGSVCSTRIETGNGCGSMSCLEECRDALDQNDFSYVKIIADGGIKNAGDCVKALTIADAVMLGNLLAGTEQAPGDKLVINNQIYKQYAGSSTHKATNVEGVSGYVPYRGDVKEVIARLMGGIRSGCSYQGVNNLEDLKLNPEFVEISNAGIVESKPHDIIL